MIFKSEENEFLGYCNYHAEKLYELDFESKNGRCFDCQYFKFDNKWVSTYRASRILKKSESTIFLKIR